MTCVLAAHNNVEDWAARARAWAAQKAAMEDHHPQTQFTQVGRTEEQNRFHDQFPQTVGSHYQDIQQQPFPSSGYQHFPTSAATMHQQPIVYSQDNASFNSGESSNFPEGHIPYTVGGGTSSGPPTTSPSVLQQEVPSSYSSVTGKNSFSILYLHMKHVFKNCFSMRRTVLHRFHLFSYVSSYQLDLLGTSFRWNL